MRDRDLAEDFIYDIFTPILPSADIDERTRQNKYSRATGRIVSRVPIYLFMPQEYSASALYGTGWAYCYIMSRRRSAYIIAYTSYARA